MSHGLVFEYERRVAFAETDMAGVAHFTSVLRWVGRPRPPGGASRAWRFARMSPTSTLVRLAQGLGERRYSCPCISTNCSSSALEWRRMGAARASGDFTVGRKTDGAVTARARSRRAHSALSGGCRDEAPRRICGDSRFSRTPKMATSPAMEKLPRSSPRRIGPTLTAGAGARRQGLARREGRSRGFPGFPSPPDS